MLKNQASCRAVSENAAIFVSQRPLCGTDTASASNHFAFSLHEAGLRGDRSNKRNLELERCLRKALVQHGADGESHAAIEQSCSKSSMNRAGGVEMPRMGFCGSNNAALGNLDNVVAERLRHRVQGQRAVDEPLNKFEAAHCSLPVVIDESEAFASREFRHEFHRELVGCHTHDRIVPIAAAEAMQDMPVALGRLRARVLLTLNPGDGSAGSRSVTISPTLGTPATCRRRARHAG